MTEALAGAHVVVATWNVRRCIGRDRRHDPDRTAAVIEELAADVIALQELHARPGMEGGVDQFAYLGRTTGMQAIPGPTLVDHRGEFGNAILTRLPVLAIERFDLSRRGREPRGGIDVQLEAHGRRLRLVATHLGLGPWERRAQVRCLLERLEGRGGDALVVLGDMNEWLPRNALAPLDARLGRGACVRSFPAQRPLLALDRIWSAPAEALADARAHASPLARVASDHLPVRAELRLPA